MALEITVEGNTLRIVCPLSAGVPSKSSGKTLVVATTKGFVEVADSDLKVSLNVIRPR